MAARRRPVTGHPSLAPEATKLLLEILDRPDPVITSAALTMMPGDIDQQLISAGLLVPHGHEAVASSDTEDDIPTSLTWSAEESQFGYFSLTRGWVSVPSAEIAMYRLDLRAFLSALHTPLGAAPRPTSLPITAGVDLLWNIGDVRLLGRTYRSPMWFVRCASDGAVWDQVRSLAQARPPDRTRILLASSPSRRLPREAPLRHILVSIHDVLELSGALNIDSSALAARVGRSFVAEPDSPLWIDPEGRSVRLHGKEFSFPKGDKQRAIIRHLYSRYQAGEQQVSVASLVAEIGLPMKFRLRDYFNRTVMTELLFEKHGMCGFRLEDDRD